MLLKFFLATIALAFVLLRFHDGNSVSTLRPEELRLQNVLLEKISLYNVKEDFVGDEIEIPSNGSFPGGRYIIDRVVVIVERHYKHWREGFVSDWKHDFLQSRNLTLLFRIFPNGVYHDHEGYVDSYDGEMSNKNPKEDPDIWVYLGVQDFQRRESNEDLEHLTMLFKFIHPQNLERRRFRILDGYPPVIDGMVTHEGRERQLAAIQFYPCSTAYKTQGVKARRCKHHGSFVFKNKDSQIFFNNDLTLEQMEQKGYLPYAVLVKPEDEDQWERQKELCNLTRRLGFDRTKTLK
jgi:hypothetical protein